jgi:hypothetical protein
VQSEFSRSLLIRNLPKRKTIKTKELKPQNPIIPNPKTPINKFLNFSLKNTKQKSEDIKYSYEGFIVLHKLISEKGGSA